MFDAVLKNFSFLGPLWPFSTARSSTAGLIICPASIGAQSSVLLRALEEFHPTGQPERSSITQLVQLVLCNVPQLTAAPLCDIGPIQGQCTEGSGTSPWEPDLCWLKLRL